MSEAVNPWRTRRKILLLVLLFALPVLAAYALYFSGWRPASTGNHGELVQPTRPIMDTALNTLDGKPIRFSALQGKWMLITFATAECLKPCEKNLYKVRQVIETQGREAERVRSVLVVTDGKALDWLQYAIKDYPDTQVLAGPTAAVITLARQFNIPAGSPLDNLNRIYLVDPLGNFLMSYPADADATGIRKDLARLLRVSRIG
ncbi:MAG: SCO family protein [Gammaproteobacteria bacterium]|nr:SCO family protein [Gammaproteobacteria bacterium]